MDHTSDNEEFDIAENYFRYHPETTKLRRKESLLSSSYIICNSILNTTDTKIFRLANKQEKNNHIGSGNFASVKLGQDKQGTYYAIKIQKINQPVRDEQAKQELITSYHAGISDGFWTKRVTASGYKRYQPMFHLGIALSPNVLALFPDEIRLNLAINLLIEVNKLHTGKASGHKYAHKDIKPANVVIDQHLNLKLIDFGFSTDDINNRKISGTPEYMAMDITHYPIFQSLTSFQSKLDFLKKHIRTNDPFQDDTIATLRTIYNPLADMDDECLFTQDFFEELPDELRAWLDTSSITPAMLDKTINHQTFMAALFILYKDNKLMEYDIASLRQDSELQSDIIEQYKQSDCYSRDEKTLLKPYFRHEPDTLEDIYNTMPLFT